MTLLELFLTVLAIAVGALLGSGLLFWAAYRVWTGK